MPLTIVMTTLILLPIQSSFNIYISRDSVRDVLLHPPLPPVLRNARPDHDLPQRLHQLGRARDSVRQHLQPPVAHTGGLRGDVVALPGGENAVQDGAPH